MGPAAAAPHYATRHLHWNVPGPTTNSARAIGTPWNVESTTGVTSCLVKAISGNACIACRATSRAVCGWGPGCPPSRAIPQRLLAARAGPGQVPRQRRFVGQTFLLHVLPPHLYDNGSSENHTVPHIQAKLFYHIARQYAIPVRRRHRYLEVKSTSFGRPAGPRLPGASPTKWARFLKRKAFRNQPKYAIMNTSSAGSCVVAPIREEVMTGTDTSPNPNRSTRRDTCIGT